MNTYQNWALLITVAIFLRLAWVYMKRLYHTTEQENTLSSALVGMLVYPVVYLLCAGLAKVMDIWL